MDTHFIAIIYIHILWVWYVHMNDVRKYCILIYACISSSSLCVTEINRKNKTTTTKKQFGEGLCGALLFYFDWETNEGWPERTQNSEYYKQWIPTRGQKGRNYEEKKCRMWETEASHQTEQNCWGNVWKVGNYQQFYLFCFAYFNLAERSNPTTCEMRVKMCVC